MEKVVTKKAAMRDFLGANYILLIDLVARCQIDSVCENMSSCIVKRGTLFGIYTLIIFFV